jgi:transcriptional regulator GlxA family with amidase domain
MKRISFLIPEATLVPLSLFGAIEIFEKANMYAVDRGNMPFYEIILTGISPTQPLLNARLCVNSLLDIELVPKSDLIIIPAIIPGSNLSNSNNQRLCNWVVNQYKEGVEIASLCSGAYFLAETGLLKGKECSTHWKCETDFIKKHPGVILHIDKIYTETNGLYTSAGALSSLNLILYLLEKFNGRDLALYCSRILEIDINRSSQSPFILFEGQRSHIDNEIIKVQDFVEKNIEAKLSVEDLASKFNISKRSFIRRFKRATNHSPLEYIQRVKMEAAKRKFEVGHMDVNDVMYSVGYVDPKAFRITFKKITGLSPADYRNRYNRDYY